MDDKRSIAYVRKLKGVADHRTVFGECAEVVGGLFEFDVCLSLCIGIKIMPMACEIVLNRAQKVSVRMISREK